MDYKGADFLARINVTDEAIMDGQPIEVYRAILDELSGFTDWWMPHILFKAKGPVDCEGAVFDVCINPKSRLSVKCSIKVTKLVEAKSIELEYVGDFVGRGVYTFEPKDEKTILRFLFKVLTKKPLFSFLAAFLDVGKAHSRVMKEGFKACNQHLAQNASMEV